MQQEITNFKRLGLDGSKPHKSRDDDAGYDLCAAEDITLPSVPKAVGLWVTSLINSLFKFLPTKEAPSPDPPELFATKVKTNIALSIPKNHFGLICDRSSMGAKAIKVMGGVIDSSYRGEILVCLLNLSFKDVEIKKGNKIAQIIILPYVNVNLREVDELDDTSRQDLGFGSSGV